MSRLIKTNPGIGDSCWLFQKLLSSHELFRFQIHDGKPQRGKQIFDLLPAIAESCEYTPGLPYNYVKVNNITNRFRLWKQIRMRDFVLSANDHLEQGHRIEDFLPDLPTSFDLPFETHQWADEAKADFPDNVPYIGIYGSAYSTTRAWGFWQEPEWLKMMLLINSLVPNGVFVHIGAEWDLAMSRNLHAMAVPHKLKQISTIGKPLGYVLEMMKRLTYGLYFPSGLGILSGLLRRPSVMFYPKHLAKMPGTWADPKLLKDGTFKECMFCSPEQMFVWLRDTYQLKDRCAKK